MQISSIQNVSFKASSNGINTKNASASSIHTQNKSDDVNFSSKNKKQIVAGIAGIAALAAIIFAAIKKGKNSGANNGMKKLIKGENVEFDKAEQKITGGSKQTTAKYSAKYGSQDAIVEEKIIKSDAIKNPSPQYRIIKDKETGKTIEIQRLNEKGEVTTAPKTKAQYTLKTSETITNEDGSTTLNTYITDEAGNKQLHSSTTTKINEYGGKEITIQKGEEETKIFVSPSSTDTKDPSKPAGQCKKTINPDGSEKVENYNARTKSKITTEFDKEKHVTQQSTEKVEKQNDNIITTKTTTKGQERAVTQTTTDKNGKVTEEVIENFDNNNNLTSKKTIRYDYSGTKPSQIIEEEGNGASRTYTAYYKNSDSIRSITKQTIDNSGARKTEITRYDQNGQVKKIIEETQTQEGFSSKTVRVEKDSKGNVQKEIEETIDNTLPLAPKAEKKTKITAPDGSVKTEQLTTDKFDAENNPIWT